MVKDKTLSKKFFGEDGNLFDKIKTKLVPWGLLDILFVYIFLFAFSIFFIGTLINLGANVDNPLFAIVIQVVISMMIIGLIYGIVVIRYKCSFQEIFGISKKNLGKHFQMGIWVAIFLALGTTLISMIISQFTPVEPQNPYLKYSPEKIKIISILAIFIAPIVEELFFRGFIQPALYRYVGIYGGILITAIIFGMSHSQYLHYQQALIAVTFIGLILGYVRYKTNSIMPAVFAHLLNNLLASIGFFI